MMGSSKSTDPEISPRRDPGDAHRRSSEPQSRGAGGTASLRAGPEKAKYLQDLVPIRVRRDANSTICSS